MTELSNQKADERKRIIIITRSEPVGEPYSGRSDLVYDPKRKRGQECPKTEFMTGERSR